MEMKYRPYQKNNENHRRTRIILLSLAILIIGLVVFNRYRKNQQAVAGDTAPTNTTENILKTDESAAPAPEPVVEKPATQDTQPAVSETAAPAVAKETPVPPVVPDPVSAEALNIIKKAVEDFNSGNVISARDQLNHALDLKISDTVQSEIKKQLTHIADKWLFNKQVCAGDTLTELYKVKPGDYLATIAKEYKVPHELIEKINGISQPELLRAGQVIKVVRGPFSVVVSKKDFTLDLYMQGVFVKEYKVGLGRVEHDTPRGKWVVTNEKMIKPQWTDPDTGRLYQGTDPDYPLGSRWIALKGLEGDAQGRTGFAIHGTKDPESIGTRASRGCIRLYNGDVVEVYDLLEPWVSEVMVVE